MEASEMRELLSTSFEEYACWIDLISLLKITFFLFFAGWKEPSSYY